jgi:hypothetical protein
LELANAFPSILQSRLFGVLDMLGMPPEPVHIIKDLYIGASMKIMTSDGLSEQNPILILL